ncbi:MAG: thermonuclease family protein [Nanoarchaeota archaeon]
MKKILIFLIFFLMFLNYIFFQNLNLVEEKDKGYYFVTKIIDGDTILANGEHIRLLGIDADEKGYECYNEAKKRLEELILNKEVLLEEDLTDKDRYGRLLRYVFLKEENINILIVEEGFAVARFYKEKKYKNEILDAEKYARDKKIGCKWK